VAVRELRLRVVGWRFGSFELLGRLRRERKWRVTPATGCAKPL
jgi:hypothetical protein